MQQTVQHTELDDYLLNDCLFFFQGYLGIFLLILQFKYIVNGMYYCINSKYEIPYLYTYWLM